MEQAYTSGMARVEVINTGTELLLGHVVNTHLGFLAREVFQLGWRIERQTTVPDGDAIGSVFDEVWSRADVVIVTGGLGPTSDDVTREIIAERLNRPLQYIDEIYKKIEARFAARGLTPGEIVRRQAMVPEGAVVLANNHGTAPGLLLEENGKVVIMLPGPPRELIPMWRDEAMPWLAKHFPQAEVLIERQWRLLGIGESTVQEMLEAPLRNIGAKEIGYCARSGEVDLRVISTDARMMDEADRVVRGLVGDYIYAEGTQSMEQRVIQLARERQVWLATAESCTGGLIAHRLTNVPGSSDVFGFGWVTYANKAKEQEIGVSEKLLMEHGAVSEAVVRAMALGALNKAGADMAVAVSGIAGPGGGTPEKPVGTLWLALATKKLVVARQHRLSRDREAFKQMASQLALDLLCRALDGRPLEFKGIG